MTKCPSPLSLGQPNIILVHHKKQKHTPWWHVFVFNLFTMIEKNNVMELHHATQQ